MAHKIKIRLFINQEIAAGDEILLSESQSHYLSHVMKCKCGEDILCFDNKNGEFVGNISKIDKKNVSIVIKDNTRKFYLPPDLWLLFAPIKKDNTDFIIQKATELGVRKIVPVITKNTITDKIKKERFKLQVIEAAEQCRRVDLPDVDDASDLKKMLQNWDEERTIFFLNENLDGQSAFESFADFHGKAAILCGPEGGFDEKEISWLKNLSFVKSVALGPRILRAETAAVTAIACFQAICGDWKNKDKNGDKK